MQANFPMNLISMIKSSYVCPVNKYVPFQLKSTFKSQEDFPQIISWSLNYMDVDNGEFVNMRHI